MIDTLCAVETPEGVELEFSPAGPVPRALAWMVDAAIRSALYAALATLLHGLGQVGMGLLMIAMFLLEWFYPVGFEVLARGQTPGKKLLGLRVLRADGAPLGWSRSTVRSLLSFADFLPFGFAAGLTAMLLDRRSRRLGDLAAGTVVVHVALDPHGTARRLPPGASAPEPVAPPFPLSLPEQRAVMGFAERAPLLTLERARELADLLEPLTGAQGDEGVRRLQAMARNLRGLA
jgi:uncharacterized RDD family membrane protein YckC